MPTDIKPYFYELKLKPYIGTNESYGNKSFTFEGHVNISLSCVNQTDKIVLHQKDLNIISVRLFEINNSYYFGYQQNEIKGHSIAYDLEKDFLIIKLSSYLVKSNHYVLSIGFSGKIAQVMYGFYRSSFIQNGTTH